MCESMQSACSTFVTCTDARVCVLQATSARAIFVGVLQATGARAVDVGVRTRHLMWAAREVFH